MRHLLGIVAMTLAASSLMAVATLHVAENGSDNASGSEADPLATVAEAIGRSASGDTVLLRRGDTFREGGLNLGGNRTLGAYGDPGNPLPNISGSVIVEGLSPWDANPEVLTVSLSGLPGEVEQVYVDDAFMPLARYPNSGWLRTENSDSNNRIDDASLVEDPENGSGRWTGAQVRWRKWSWWYETRPIIGDNGNGSLMLGGSTSGGNRAVDSGYYIDNALEALDAHGEWFWDTGIDRLYLYPPEGVDPETMVVEVAVRADGIGVGAGSQVENIAFRHFTNRAINVGGQAIVSNCLFEHIGNDGITASWGAGGSTISGNIIRDVLGGAIVWNENPTGTTGTVFEGNLIQNAGVVRGLGGSGPWATGGIFISNGNGVVVRRNHIDGTGYAGITFNSDGMTAQENILRNTMLTLNDGAAIYCNSGRNTITGNVIINTRGDLDSTQPWTPLSHGIWVEFLSNFADSVITGNIVYGSDGHGIWHPNNFDCVISDNLLVSNRLRNLELSGSGGGSQRHVIENNVLVQGATGWLNEQAFENLRDWPEVFRACLGFEDDGTDFGSMSGTVFVRPEGVELVHYDYNQYHSISEWQNAEGAWADPSPTVVTGNAYFFLNDTFDAYTFTLPTGIAWENLDGDAVSGTLMLDELSGQVLMAESGDTSGLYDLFLASAEGFPDFPAPPIATHDTIFIQNKFGRDIEYPLDPRAVWYHVDGSPAGDRVKIGDNNSVALVIGGGDSGLFGAFSLLSESNLGRTFPDWATENGFSASVSPDVDNDGDGLPDVINHLMNHALGNRSTGDLQIREGHDDNEWFIRFPRRKFLLDVAANVQTSLTLGNSAEWNTATTIGESVITHPNPWTEWVELSIDVSGSQFFTRLTVSIEE